MSVELVGLADEHQVLVPDLARSLLSPQRILHLPASHAMRQRLLAELYPVAGGANTYPTEGLKYLIGGVPQGTRTSNPTTLYLGLFTSQTASTVPSDDSTLTGSTTSPYTTGTSAPVEATGGGYARVSVANTAWAATTTNGFGQRTTASQQSFAQSTGSQGTINGFFLATAASSTGQNTGTTIYYSNFADTSSVAINAAGFVLSVTPFFELDSSQ